MMKKNYKEMTKPERQAEYAAVKAEFEGAKALHLELNMARGKPSRQQLDMVTPMLQVLTQPEQFVSDGVETRNYGEVAGIPAARKLFADILGCKPEQVFVGGNASLQQLQRLLDDRLRLLHRYLNGLRLDHRLGGRRRHGGDGSGLDLNDGVRLLHGGVGGKQGDIANRSGGQQAQSKGYVKALAAEHGLDLGVVESAHTRLSGGTHPPPPVSGLRPAVIKKSLPAL